MEMTEFIRKPFLIEAIQITEENIFELAKKIGTVHYDEETNAPYIQVDRRLIPNLYRVYPGYWLTKFGNKSRCYAGKVFEEEFIASTPARLELFNDLVNEPVEAVDEG